jgi:hypothetical protein
MLGKQLNYQYCYVQCDKHTQFLLYLWTYTNGLEMQLYLFRSRTDLRVRVRKLTILMAKLGCVATKGKLVRHGDAKVLRYALGLLENGCAPQFVACMPWCCDTHSRGCEESARAIDAGHAIRFWNCALAIGRATQSIRLSLSFPICCNLPAQKARRHRRRSSHSRLLTLETSPLSCANLQSVTTHTSRLSFCFCRNPFYKSKQKK